DRAIAFRRVEYDLADHRKLGTEIAFERGHDRVGCHRSYRFRKAHREGNGFRAAAAVAFLCAAVEKRFPRCPRTDKECADAFWSVNFMSGDRKQIDAPGTNVDRHFSKGLYGVGVDERRALLLHSFGNFRNGARRSGLVVHCHQRGECGFGPDSFYDRWNGNASELISLSEFRYGPEFRKPLNGFEHRMMLHTTCHNVNIVPRATRFHGFEDCAFDRGIIGFGAPGRENDLLRLSMDRPGDGFARILECDPSCTAQ